MQKRDSWFDRVGFTDEMAIQGDCEKLVFTHGIETEYFLVDRNGRKLTHAEFGLTYNKLISQHLVRELEMLIPLFYDRKVSNLAIGTSKSSTYDALHIEYDTRGTTVKAELLSVDRNVAEWPLIELATPPCETLYELGWWSSVLYSIVNDRLSKLNDGNTLLPFGVNPFERVEDIVHSDSFPTCGEHHHIKVFRNADVERDERRVFSNFYHMVRFFAPYLILLSACSPFASGRMWGRFRRNDPEQLLPGCVRSLRVIYNKKHLCNFQEGEYLPYLEEGWQDEKYFLSEFRKQTGSFRTDSHFFDMDPLSKTNGTTEIRFFDSQPSVARRVGLAAVIQMLARKAVSMGIDREDNLAPHLVETNPDLLAVKKVACEGGNWFRPPINPRFIDLGEFVKLKRSGRDTLILSDLVLGMLYVLKDEFKTSNLIYSRFLEPIRHSIFGLDGNGISPAQYWLLVHAGNGEDMSMTVKGIMDAAGQAANMWYDPIVNEPIILDKVLDTQGNRR
jgi:hypothetical protein